MVDVRGFNGGLNMDDAKELLRSGDYTYAYNISNGSEGITNLPGNTLIEGVLPSPVGIEWICGSFFDKTRQRIIYFTHNNKGYHRIISVNVIDNTHTVLFQDEPTATEIVSVTENRVMTFLPGSNTVIIQGFNLNLSIGDLVTFTNTTLSQGPGNNNGTYTVVEFSYNAFTDTNIIKLGGGGDISLGSGGTITYNSINELGFGAFNWELYDTFNPNGLIKDIKVIHREYEGDLYYFIDPKKKLSKFNYDTLLDWTSNSVTVKSEYFSVIKAPPKDIISVDVIDDENYKINNLYKKLFQFKYRFVYDDNEKSVWSAISKIAYPSNSTDPLYNIIGNVQNAIELKLNTGDINVAKIEIAGRVNIESEWSDFFLVDTLVKSRESIDSNIIYKYIFKNDSVYTPIDIQESNLLFDYVPDESNALELANGNTLVVGGIKDGYNRDLPLDVFFTTANAKSPAVVSTLDFSLKNDSSSGPYAPFTFNQGPSVTGYNKFVAATISFTGTPQVGDLITIVVSGYNKEYWFDGFSINATTRRIDWTYNVVVQPTWGIPQIITAFNSYQSLPGSYNITANNSPYVGLNSSRPSKPFGEPSGTVDPNTLYLGSFCNTGVFDSKEWRYDSISVSIRNSYSFGESDVFSTYKWNGLYKFGLVYYDKNGKTNGVFTSNKMSIRTGTYNTSYEWTPITIPNTVPENPTCQLYIGHEPPPWADYYHIVRTKELSCDLSLMVISCNITEKDNSGYVYLDIENIQDTNDAAKETSDVIKYNSLSFVPGDRVRILQKYNSTTLSVTWDNKDFLDLPIFSVETIASRLRLKVKDVDTSSNPNLISIANGDKTVIEIYRPAKVLSDEDLVYYEIGYKYDIITDADGTRYHGGQDVVVNKALSGSYSLGTPSDFSSVFFNGNILTAKSTSARTENVFNSFSVGDYFSVSGNPLNVGPFLISDIKKINNTNIEITIDGAFVTSPDDFISITRVTKPDTKYAFVDMFGDGDYYYKTRTMICDTTTTNFGPLYVAEKNFSETYLSAVWSQGRPLVVDENIKEEYYPSMLRFSQSYIYGTNINNVSRFYPNNFEEADASFGPILRLKTRENFIRMFQRYKVGMIPIYRQIIIDNAASSQVALSERLLNKPNYYSGEYGIDKYGSSLVSTDYGDYFVDTINKAIVRVSLDGVTNISDTNNLASWANDSIKEDSYGYGCFNYENRNVIMLVGRVIDVEGIPTPQIENEIVAYSESDKKFESFYGYNKAQSILFINGFVYTLWANSATTQNPGNHLYKHDSSIRNNFFGEQQQSEIKTVFNGNVQIKKTYTAIEELANGLWTGEITTGPLLNQFSTIELIDFVKTYETFTINKKENKFNATLKRNMKYNGFNFPERKFSGDSLKGLWAEVLLSNSSTTEQRLISVSLKYIPSPLTNT